MMNYYLIGIGGMGMSALAQVLVHEGNSVGGSDRDKDFELLKRLKKVGVKIFEQDGSGIVPELHKVVVSRAVEDDNPDLVKARSLGLSISYRQDVLKDLFRRQSGVAVAGTSGKSTVVGMIGCIFDRAGQDFTVVNGGIINNYANNVRIGRVSRYCVETDESEGDLKGFCPEIGVLTNIGPDHLSRRKLVRVYKEFVSEVKDMLVVNADSHFNVPKVKRFTYGIYNDSDMKATDVQLFPTYSVFCVDRCKIKLPVPGLYNVYNALAALAVAKVWGVPLPTAGRGLARFKGIRRRFEVLGERNGMRVIDDYAHNPDKIKASLDTARLGAKRVIAVYQPHGFRPTKMFFGELVDVFARNLGKEDFLFMPEIFYAGGKVKKNVSSSDVIREVKKKNRALKAKFLPYRNNIVGEVRSVVLPGDTILVMGARDKSLSELGRSLLR